MVVRISDERIYLWRAVDHEGEVLDMLVQRTPERRCSWGGVVGAVALRNEALNLHDTYGE
jgi:hypothetical protein